MAIWIDPVIEFIVREAHQDMGTFYQTDLHVVPILTADDKLMALVWNEGEIKTLYSMEQQGVYVSVMFEPQILGYNKRQVGRALYDFENALLGAVLDDMFQSEDDTRPDYVHPNKRVGNPAHHNVAGHPIRQTDMELLDLKDTYEELAEGRPGWDKDTKNWWPTHIVQKVTVEGVSIKYDPTEKFWRGRIFIHAHIANEGTYGE